MAISPINYMLGGPSAPEMAMAGFGAGQQRRATEQGMAIESQDATQRQAMNQQTMDQSAQAFDWAAQDRSAAQAQAAQAQAAAQQQQQDIVKLTEGLKDGTLGVQDIATFKATHPELSTAMLQGMDMFSEDRKKNEAFRMGQIASAIKADKPELAISMLEQASQAAANSGNKMEADMYRGAAELLKTNPEAGMFSVGILLDGLDPEMAKRVFPDAQSMGDRFKVVGDQLIDLQAEGGPKPVEGMSKTNNGVDWVDLTPEELAKYGFVFGQRNTKTGKVEGEKPPKGQTISLGADGSLTITDAPATQGGARQTEGTLAADAFMGRMTKAEDKFAELEGQGVLSLGLTDLPVVDSAMESYKLSSEEQQLLQAQRDWVRAKLRKESGAVIGEDEMIAEMRTYFPQPGDGPEVIAQKKESRKAAIEQMKVMSGKSSDPASDSGSPDTTEIDDLMNG